jgi:endonuclease-3
MQTSCERKSKFISEKLLELYPKIDIPLSHYDAFTMLIAVILSAQCTDARVNQVTKILFKIAPTAESLSLMPIEEIEQIIFPCGFYHQKAKFISQTAKIIHKKYNNVVPCDMELLEQLPGVGHKTASVVMSQFFKMPAFPVDTHIQRLARRWEISDSKNVEIIEQDLKNFFDRSLWIDLSLRMILFGREYCPARNHNIIKCPICSIVPHFQ